MSTKAVKDKAGSARPKRKVKRSIAQGVVHVQATFNNTLVCLTDPQGNTLAWATAGGLGFKGSRKSTPYAAQMAARKVAQSGKEFGVKSVDIIVKGPGPGRESVVRAMSESFKINLITDDTGVPYNGCQPPKQRRV